MIEKKGMPSGKKVIEKREKKTKKSPPNFLYRKANVKRFFFQLWETPCELLLGRPDNGRGLGHEGQIKDWVENFYLAMLRVTYACFPENPGQSRERSAFRGR